MDSRGVQNLVRSADLRANRQISNENAEFHIANAEMRQPQQVWPSHNPLRQQGVSVDIFAAFDASLTSRVAKR